MAVIHISEEEAARTLPELIAKVKAGEQVQIDSGWQTFALVPAAQMPRKPWTISDAIMQAEARGSNVTLDDEFGADMEEIMSLNRLPRDQEPWE